MKDFALYKPASYKQKDNPNIFAGAAFSWKLWRTEKGLVIMMEGVRQKSYDPDKRLGSFYNGKDNPDECFRVKFNEIEVGGLIRAIRVYDNFKAYHSFDTDKTSIDFVTYEKKPKGNEPPGKAFSLTVKRNGVPMGIGIELAEAEALRVFLETALAEVFYAGGQNFNKGE